MKARQVRGIEYKICSSRVQEVVSRLPIQPHIRIGQDQDRSETVFCISHTQIPFIGVCFCLLYRIFDSVPRPLRKVG